MHWILWFFTGLLCFGVYTETGIWTVLAFLLVTAGIELMVWHVRQLQEDMRLRALDLD